MLRPEENEHERQARKESIKKALIAWAEIFPEQAPIDDEEVQRFEQGLYVVGNRYPIQRTGGESYLSGVRLGYSRFRQALTLYANDYHGDPAPLLIQLARELQEKGITIRFMSRQAAYDPPDPKTTEALLDEYNSQFKK